ncbi:helix-turn-helix transcriptional regulator [Candidatus Hodarchaeum mangrovi]
MSEIMNPSKEKILQYLLVTPAREENFKGKTINEIAAEVDLSTNAVRKYLFELESGDYIAKKVEKQDIGRPVVRYSLRSKALDLFPKFYAEFTISLIDELKKELGESRMHKILTNVGQTIGKDIKIDYANHEDITIEQRIITLVKIFEDFGKYPTISEDDEFYYIRNSNCLLFSVVKEHSILCEVDQNIVEVLLGSKAEKQQCLKNEDGFCQYRVKKV